MTSTEIVNIALGMIGQNEIASLDDEGDTEIKCRRLYDPTRRACLRDHKWNFAKRWKALARVATTISLGSWAYAYRVPPSSVRVLELNGSDCARWELAGDEGGALLVTDETAAVIGFIDDVSADKWDALFVNAFATYLASKLASAIAHDGDMALKLYKLYQAEYDDALAVDGQESGLPDQMRSPDLTTNVRRV